MGEKLAEITIYTNDEGFLYGLDQEVIDGMDVEKSVKKFQEQCKARLELVYPECTFILKHENYSGKSIRIEDLTDIPFDNPVGWESDYIQELVEIVFNNDMFWVVK